MRIRHLQVLGKVGSVSGASRAPASGLPMPLGQQKDVEGAKGRGEFNSPRKHAQLSRQTLPRKGEMASDLRLFSSHT